MWIALSAVGVVALLGIGCQATRAGYKTAPYTVARSAGKFELRDYPALTVAETSAAPTGGAEDGSFQRLFRFIAGGNEAKQKIAMTTPVFMTGGTNIPTMAFVMPEKLGLRETPKPSDSAVKVRELPAGRFAVFRYSGGRKANNEIKSLERLKTWMATEGLVAASEPVYGYFDPPWTPPFLRRNEVMLRAGTAK